jgi:hypothetical protein
MYAHELAIHNDIFHCFRTLKKGCPFTIKVRASDDGEKLVVVRFDPEGSHNHDVNRVRVSTTGGSAGVATLQGWRGGGFRNRLIGKGLIQSIEYPQLIVQDDP